MTMMLCSSSNAQHLMLQESSLVLPHVPSPKHSSLQSLLTTQNPCWARCTRRGDRSLLGAFIFKTHLSSVQPNLLQICYAQARASPVLREVTCWSSSFSITRNHCAFQRWSQPPALLGLYPGFGSAETRKSYPTSRTHALFRVLYCLPDFLSEVSPGICNILSRFQGAMAPTKTQYLYHTRPCSSAATSVFFSSHSSAILKQLLLSCSLMC